VKQDVNHVKELSQYVHIVIFLAWFRSKH